MQEPICPNCHNEVDTIMSDIGSWDGHTGEIDCEHCGTTLKVTTIIEYEVEVLPPADTPA